MASVEFQSRFQLYAFGAAIVLAAGSLWAIQMLAFSMALIAFEYRIAIACAFGVLLLTAARRTAAWADLSGNLVRDWTIVTTNRLTWVAILATILMTVLRPSPVLTAIPTGEAFLRWFKSRPRADVPASYRGSAKAVLLVFNDYQCPACKAAMALYQPLFDRLGAELDPAFRVVLVDYPLEAECNDLAFGPFHESACEAAVAMRLARERGSATEMADWLWTNQEHLTPATVLDAAATVGGVFSIRERYADKLVAVRDDVALGRALGVRGTPTFFLNGVRLIPQVPLADLEAIVRYEIDHVGTTTPGSADTQRSTDFSGHWRLVEGSAAPETQSIQQTQTELRVETAGFPPAVYRYDGVETRASHRPILPTLAEVVYTYRSTWVGNRLVTRITTRTATPKLTDVRVKQESRYIDADGRMVVELQEFAQLDGLKMTGPAGAVSHGPALTLKDRVERFVYVRTKPAR